MRARRSRYEAFEGNFKGGRLALEKDELARILGYFEVTHRKVSDE